MTKPPSHESLEKTLRNTTFTAMHQPFTMAHNGRIVQLICSISLAIPLVLSEVANNFFILKNITNDTLTSLHDLPPKLSLGCMQLKAFPVSLFLPT